MSYIVLARKWRPKGFEDLIGQEPIARILKNSLNQDKLAHAYVFSGPRGVGKTSTARILAKCLNCVEGPTDAPCGKCPSCVSISEGSSVDVMEIDGASNNSVNDIRDLRDRVNYAPSGGKYKVYIIDEAHMLSTGAFNALLKTLEEPPPYVVFVLATTESRKIPVTVLSRCQHLPFRRIKHKEITQRLQSIASAEGMNISSGALSLIGRAADGSIRDSLTLLDQAASFTNDIDASTVSALLDISDTDAVASVGKAALKGDRAEILKTVAGLVEGGIDIRIYIKDLIRFFRDSLIAKILPREEYEDDIGEDAADSVSEIAQSASEEQLLLVLNELLKAEGDVRYSFAPRVALEMALLKISYLSRFQDVKEAFESIKTNKPNAVRKQPSMHEGLTHEAPKPQAARPAEAPRPPAKKQAMDGASLISEIVSKISDVRTSSLLAKADAVYKGGVLNLTFSGVDADICAGPFLESPELAGAPASSILGVPVEVRINVKKSKFEDAHDLKKRVMNEPAVKEALELFEGSIIDIKQTENESGG